MKRMVENVWRDIGIAHGQDGFYNQTSASSISIHQGSTAKACPPDA